MLVSFIDDKDGVCVLQCGTVGVPMYSPPFNKDGKKMKVRIVHSTTDHSDLYFVPLPSGQLVRVKPVDMGKFDRPVLGTTTKEKESYHKFTFSFVKQMKGEAA